MNKNTNTWARHQRPTQTYSPSLCLEQQQGDICAEALLRVVFGRLVHASAKTCISRALSRLIEGFESHLSGNNSRLFCCSSDVHIAARHEVCRWEVTGAWGIFRLFVHLAHSIYVYIQRVLPTRRWAMIYSVIKDLKIFRSFLEIRLSVTSDAEDNRLQKKSERWCGRGKDEKQCTFANTFCKTDTRCRWKPKQRLFVHMGFRTDRR